MFVMPHKQLERQSPGLHQPLLVRRCPVSPPTPLVWLPPTTWPVLPSATDTAAGTVSAMDSNLGFLTPTPSDTDWDSTTVAGITTTPTITSTNPTMDTVSASAANGTGMSCNRPLTLPGPKTFCGNLFWSVREALTSQLLVSHVHVAVGRARKNGWVKFYEQTLGITPGPIPALMVTFTPYSSAKAWAKFKKFVLSGIAYNDAIYLDKVSCGTSLDHLEECAHRVTQEMDASLKATEDARLAMAQHVSELHANNEASEYVMGLHTSASNHEQGPPLVCDLTDDSNLVAALGPRPSFRSCNGRVFFSLFVLLCWSLTSFFFNIGGANGHSESRATLERDLAKAAGTDRARRVVLEQGVVFSTAGGISAPSQFAPGELAKKRRHVDVQDCMDDLVNGMMSEAGLMAEAIKFISAPTAESPTKKRQRQIISIMENLKLLYQEKKMRIDLEMHTTNVDTQIRKLINMCSTL
jgi:hypothetical protein